MRSSVILPVLVSLCLFATVASADGINEIRPNQFPLGSVENFITIYGSGLLGNVATHVEFDGPSGNFVVDPSVDSTTTSSAISVYVPDGLTSVAGTYSVTVHAIDDNGERTIGPGYITVVAPPVGPPVLSLPETVVANAIDANGGNATFSVSATNGDGTVSVPISCNHASGELFPLGVTTVTCSATDLNGTTTGGFLVLITDWTVPTISVPADFTTTNSTVTYTVTAFDNVDGTITSSNPNDPAYVICSPPSGSVFPNGTTTVSCTVTDSYSNSATATFHVTVGTIPPPTLTLPGTIIVEATSGEGTPVSYSATADQGATVSCSPASGSLFSLGTTTVYCTATNSQGGTSSGSFSVIVRDTTAPVLTLPADFTVQAMTSGGEIVTYVTSVTDNFDNSLVADCSPASGEVFPVGTTTVSCVATDGQGNSSSGTFKVTVKYGNPPVLTVPNDITAEATGPNGAVVTFTATATESGVVSCSPASGSTFALGTTNVNCTATNPYGSDFKTFHVTVVDTTAPSLSLPSNLTREATSASGAVVTFSATAYDIVDGSIGVTCVPPSGSTFALGTTSVGCTVTDAHGNSSSGGFTVTVRDTTPPSLNLPSNVVAEATSASGAAVTYSATASDLVDGSVGVTCTPPSGSTFAIGTTTVNCSSTDAHGNTGTGSFTVVVQDTTGPTIVSIVADPKYLEPQGDHGMKLVTITVNAYDSVDPAPVSQIISVTSDQPVVSGENNDGSPDWIITGALTVQLRQEQVNKQVRTYTITIRTTDSYGNSTIGTVIVQVVKDGKRRAT